MAQMPEVGTPAPIFTLPDATETPVSLNDFRGKWVVLYFYPKDNTPGCTTEALEFSAARQDFAKQNAVVIGLSPDNCKSHARFIETQGLNVILLSDPEHKVLEQYGVWQEKSMYGRKYMGVQRATVLIDPQGGVRFVWPAVKPRGHASEVLQKLRELAAAGE